VADVTWCDAEEPDAREPDAREPDAGEPDAGEPDAGERRAAAVAVKAMTAAMARTTPVMSMVSFFVGRTGERPLQALIVTERRFAPAARE
jgi:hypothetical protein